MATYDNLPAKLRESGLFCLWRYEMRPGEDKPTKKPYNPKTGGGAQSNNPAAFAPFTVALDALESSKTRDTPYTGLGIGIFGDVGGIDIDHCIDENGELSDMAADIMETMGAYVEKSPSGHGLRILFTVPEGWAYDKTRYYIKNSRIGLEVYVAGATNRFLTVTGDTLLDMDLEERGAQLQQILDKYMLRQKPDQPDAAPGSPVCLDDMALIEKAKRSRDGQAFSALWSGNSSGYDSRSEADLALCNRLAFWTDRDAKRTDRLFRASGLMREKWDRPQSGSTYGAITVQNAVNSCQNGYRPEQYRREKAETDSAAPPSVRPTDFSDAGNAEVFAREYKGSLIYTDALGWLWWNGKKWERDDHKALAWAIRLSGKMLREAGRENREALTRQAEARARYAESGGEEDSQAVKEADTAVKKAGAYLKHAQNTRNAVKIRNMLELSKPALVIRADRLDANTADLNTPAGIVNLATGKLRPHDREAYCSQITSDAPGKAGAEMWSSFLDTITQGDEGIKGFLQMVAGMALYGEVYHEGIILAYGGGRNGKSTFFNALAAAVGDYAGSIAVDTLTTNRNNKDASLATLRGKRLAITGELEENQRLSVAMLKRVASTDRLVVEEKYRQAEEVKPSHSLVLFTNHLPRVGSTDSGTWRRLTVVPFNATIPEGSGIANYAEALAKEAGPAILAWAVEGAVNFARNRYKLDIPEAVEEATDAYREREDWLTNFINERCVLDPNGRVQSSLLYENYREWAIANGEFARRLNDFAAAMEVAGFRKIAPKNRKYWIGLRIDIEAKLLNRCAASP